MTAEPVHTVEHNGGNGADGKHNNTIPDEGSEYVLPSLITPITSTATEPNFIEIFPEELKDISPSTLLQVLQDENAGASVWADAGLSYMQQGMAEESSAILQAACDRDDRNRGQRVRLLASAGIAVQATHKGVVGKPEEDEQLSLADQRFTAASKVDTFYPMTWMGRGTLNFKVNRLEQARFFFDTTLKQKGPVLPALLGMASVLYKEGNFKKAQAEYAKAIRRYPEKSGAAVRVGFGMACYRLGQVDRAKASFARALEMDPEYVPAMVGAAILDMASLDSTQPDFAVRTEKAIRMISMANLLDQSNAMVQNHLANHYFWKWTPLAGSVAVERGSKVVKGSQVVQLEAGERIRIGMDFETVVEKEDDDEVSFHIRNTWKADSAGEFDCATQDRNKIWKTGHSAFSCGR